MMGHLDCQLLPGPACFFNAQISRNYFHIRGGNDLLPTSLALKLGDVILYGCLVNAISQNERSAWVRIETAGGQETLIHDVVLLLKFLP
jgi:monoamine oxidase